MSYTPPEVFEDPLLRELEDYESQRSIYDEDYDIYAKNIYMQEEW
jgi:hypothetical protein